VLTALGLTCRLALTSFWFSCVVGLILGIVLVRAYTHFGLTALLAAALTSAVLPAALFSLLHFSWLTSSALLLLATAAAPLVFGSIGIRRPEGVEDGPYTLPAFVRRLEEENRVKYEMELLAKMQLGLLPRETPRVDGYEIAARSILATEAGGDLYDFVHDANGRIWIAAGDVSGHGYSCAIAQAMTKAGLASLVEAERTPAGRARPTRSRAPRDRRAAHVHLTGTAAARSPIRRSAPEQRRPSVSMARLRQRRDARARAPLAPARPGATAQI
jgi:hypothetical protein